MKERARQMPWTLRWAIGIALLYLCAVSAVASPDGCQQALLLSDTNRDELLNRYPEYLFYLNQLSESNSPFFSRYSGFEELPISLKDNYRQFANPEGYINITEVQSATTRGQVDELCEQTKFWLASINNHRSYLRRATNRAGLSSSSYEIFSGSPQLESSPKDDMKLTQGEGTSTVNTLKVRGSNEKQNAANSPSTKRSLAEEGCGTFIQFSDLDDNSSLNRQEFLILANLLADSDLANTFEDLPSSLKDTFVELASPAAGDEILYAADASSGRYLNVFRHGLGRKTFATICSDMRADIALYLAEEMAPPSKGDKRKQCVQTYAPMFDADGDGSLSAEEYAMYVQAVAHAPSQAGFLDLPDAVQRIFFDQFTRANPLAALLNTDETTTHHKLAVSIESICGQTKEIAAAMRVTPTSHQAPHRAPSLGATLRQDGTAQGSCTQNPLDYNVNIDIQITFLDNEFAVCDSPAQYEAINTNIQQALNENFATTVTDWQGTATFGSFIFDESQEVNNVEGNDDVIFQDDTVQDDDNNLPTLCPSRAAVGCGAPDYCRWGCVNASTTNCGNPPSTTDGWTALEEDIRARLAGLGFDCLGLPDQLQVVLVTDAPATQTNANAPLANATSAPQPGAAVTTQVNTTTSPVANSTATVPEVNTTSPPPPITNSSATTPPQSNLTSTVPPESTSTSPNVTSPPQSNITSPPPSNITFPQDTNATSPPPANITLPPQANTTSPSGVNTTAPPQSNITLPPGNVTGNMTFPPQTTSPPRGNITSPPIGNVTMPPQGNSTNTTAPMPTAAPSNMTQPNGTLAPSMPNNTFPPNQTEAPTVNSTAPPATTPPTNTTAPPINTTAPTPSPTLPATTVQPAPTPAPGPTQNVRVYNSWVMSNGVDQTAADIVADTAAVNAAEEGYAAFVDEIVAEMARERAAIRRLRRRRLVVSKQAGSTSVDRIDDSTCPEGSGPNLSCVTVFGSSTLVTDEDTTSVSNEFTVNSQAAIDSGQLETNLAEANPGTLWTVESSSTPVNPDDGVPDPPTESPEADRGGSDLVIGLVISCAVAFFLVLVVCLLIIIPACRKKRELKKTKKDALEALREAEAKHKAALDKKSKLKDKKDDKAASAPRPKGEHDETDNPYRDEVEKLINNHCPDVIDELDSMLHQYQGREEELIAILQDFKPNESLLSRASDCDVFSLSSSSFESEESSIVSEVPVAEIEVDEEPVEVSRNIAMDEPSETEEPEPEVPVEVEEIVEDSDDDDEDEEEPATELVKEIDKEPSEPSDTESTASDSSRPIYITMRSCNGLEPPDDYFKLEPLNANNRNAPDPPDEGGEEQLDPAEDEYEDSETWSQPPDPDVYEARSEPPADEPMIPEEVVKPDEPPELKPDPEDDFEEEFEPVQIDPPEAPKADPEDYLEMIGQRQIVSAAGAKAAATAAAVASKKLVEEDEKARQTLEEEARREAEEEEARKEAEEEGRRKAEEEASLESKRLEQEWIDLLEAQQLEAEMLEQERRELEENLQSGIRELEQQDAEQLEEERIAAEAAAKCEAEEESRRKAEEEARQESRRLEQEWRDLLEMQEEEAERLAKEQLEADRLEQEAEADRLAKEQLEADRLAQEVEAERLAQEQLEAERLAKEKLEAERLEEEGEIRGLELLDTETVEPEKVEAEEAQQEVLKVGSRDLQLPESEEVKPETTEEMVERLVQERLEAERLKREQLEQERLEQERLEAERLEQERMEAERLEAERLEQERLEAERLEAERRERDQLVERLVQEQLEAAKLKREKLEQERQAETERLEGERQKQRQLEQEQLEAARRELEKLKSDKVEAERLEQERLEAEKLEAERLEQKRLEAERLAQDQLEAERLEREHAEQERQAERREQARLQEAEKLEEERFQQELEEARRREKKRFEQEQLDKAKLDAARLEAARREAETKAAVAKQARVEAEQLARAQVKPAEPMKGTNDESETYFSSNSSETTEESSHIKWVQSNGYWHAERVWPVQDFSESTEYISSDSDEELENDATERTRWAQHGKTWAREYVQEEEMSESSSYYSTSSDEDDRPTTKWVRDSKNQWKQVIVVDELGYSSGD